jgi:hypothetical protein
MGCDSRPRPDGLWDFVSSSGESFTVDATIQGHCQEQNDHSSNVANAAMRRLIESGTAMQAEIRCRAAELFHPATTSKDTAKTSEFTREHIDHAERMSPGFAARVLKIAQATDDQKSFDATCALTLTDLVAYYFVQLGDFDALLKLEGFSGELGKALEKIADRHGLDFSGVRAVASWLIASTIGDELAAANASRPRND